MVWQAFCMLLATSHGYGMVSRGMGRSGTLRATSGIDVMASLLCYILTMQVLFEDGEGPVK